jgi:hypothetical protein
MPLKLTIGLGLANAAGATAGLARPTAVRAHARRAATLTMVSPSNL